MRLCWLALVATAGCGLLSGLDQLSVDDGGADVVVPNDATADVASDVSIDVGACESGACGASPGFQPVLFAADRSTPCPSGSTTLDSIVDPSLPPSPCACECNYQPSCLPQANSFQFGAVTCTTPLTLGQLDGGCNTVNTSFGSGSFHMEMGPFPPSNTCTNAPKATAKATTPSGRLCTLGDCSACAPVTGFSLCYAQVGDVACPPSTTKHTVGTDATLVCSACTACTSTAQCKGTLGLFGDTKCTNTVATVTVNGTCQGVADSKINSVHYTPNTEVGTCTPGTSTASLGITGRTTVCCP